MIDYDDWSETKDSRQREASSKYRDEARHIGAMLNEHQVLSGMTNEECCNQFHVIDRTWGAWKRGHQKPAPKYAARIVAKWPGMEEVFALYGVGNWRTGRGHSLIAPATGAQTSEQRAKEKRSHLTTAQRWRRRFLIEERWPIVKKQCEQRRSERNRHATEGSHQGMAEAVSLDQLADTALAEIVAEAHGGDRDQDGALGDACPLCGIGDGAGPHDGEVASDQPETIGDAADHACTPRDDGLYTASEGIEKGPDHAQDQQDPGN